LAVTYKCNWNCDYCLVNTHKRKPRKFDDILKDIESFEENSSVTISGGEPGMLTETEVQIIFERLREKNITIDLLTNGLFFEKHSQYMKYIDEILYHCIEDLKERKPIIKYYYNNMYYVMVITNKDLDKMSDILWYFKKYPEIKFLLSPDIKAGERIHINKFLKLLKEYPENINERTKNEFVRNIS
jgi:organic radical activating enzyme